MPRVMMDRGARVFKVFKFCRAACSSAIGKLLAMHVCMRVCVCVSQHVVAESSNVEFLILLHLPQFPFPDLSIL